MHPFDHSGLHTPGLLISNMSTLPFFPLFTLPCTPLHVTSGPRARLSARIHGPVAWRAVPSAQATRARSCARHGQPRVCLRVRPPTAFRPAGPVRSSQAAQYDWIRTAAAPCCRIPDAAPVLPDEAALDTLCDARHTWYPPMLASVLPDAQLSAMLQAFRCCCVRKAADSTTGCATLLGRPCC